MIAITGANGLLGSFIVRRLLEERREFIALKRHVSDTSLLSDVQDRIQWHDADVVDPVSIESALSDHNVNQVIHAAAVVSFDPARKAQLFDVNVNGTRNVVNACLNLGVEKLIHISSVAALGRNKERSEIDENHQWVENALNSNYAESKYLAELEVYRGFEEGLKTTILNPSVILAPADWEKSSAKLFKYVWDQKKYFIDKDLNYVDVRDVAAAATLLLREDHSGERFIVNGGRITIEEFFNQVASRLNRRPPSRKVGQGLLQAIARVETIRSKLLGTEPLITRETARLAGTYFFYSSDKIKNRLNFEFKTIDQTLNWCCDYYINRSNAKK